MSYCFLILCFFWGGLVKIFWTLLPAPSYSHQLIQDYSVLMIRRLAFGTSLPCSIQFFWPRVAMQGSTPCKTGCRSCLAAIRNLKIFLITCCDAGKYVMRDLVQNLPSGNPQLNLFLTDHLLRCREVRHARSGAEVAQRQSATRCWHVGRHYCRGAGNP